MQKILAWSYSEVGLAFPRLIPVQCGDMGRTQQERPGVALRGKLLTVFLLLQPFGVPEQVGRDSNRILKPSLLASLLTSALSNQ